MNKTGTIIEVNRNPLAFEELATSLASLISYIDIGKEKLGMQTPIDEFERLYSRALSEPASYKEITELTGQSMNTGDQRASRAAWILRKIKNLDIVAVHSQWWHKKADKFSIPIMAQINRSLGIDCELTDCDLQNLGKKREFLNKELSLIDVVAVEDDNIWLVQTAHRANFSDSAVKFFQSEFPLFRTRGNVFENIILGGPSLMTLYDAEDIVKVAFPTVKIFSMVMVLHPETPDFELYKIKNCKHRAEEIVLLPDMIMANSIDFKDEIEENREYLTILSERFDNDLFKGLPPCRGGRTLNILASVCKRQLKANRLLVWKEKEVSEILKLDYDYVVPRDKIRHDLVDRLVGQGFMKKWGSEYSLTVKGLARYQYCLAKYTTVGTDDPQEVLGVCVEQRDRIMSKYGCV